ncbi:MAG: hypothetical protein KJ904_18370 [Alphaproteobacteria bacterium]|nr:hypothetical protein [Alphaproteobacteria bacterium]MBU0798606.1 hypothetical protein [Alphaproteobacteria bacterium]MBU0889125.1 hypothetical protein [Alphaproteobacteria bacterium]MBU1812159.1 hypothetical protein [Alphaproteobacteria bacterium]MBU2089445.1 hypothetical protein [Alphaproteobacteria bacterium]
MLERDIDKRSKLGQRLLTAYVLLSWGTLLAMVPFLYGQRYFLDFWHIVLSIMLVANVIIGTIVRVYFKDYRG